jgi:hypothetical protein
MAARAHLAEVGFLLILIVGVGMAAAEIPQQRVGLKLGPVTGICAVEVEYQGPAKPKPGEFISHYEVQAEEEGGARAESAIEVVVLEAG